MKPAPHQRPHLVGVARLAIGSEPHHLVLAVVHLETQVGGQRAVEQTQGARELDLLEEVDARARGLAESGECTLKRSILQTMATSGAGAPCIKNYLLCYTAASRFL